MAQPTRLLALLVAACITAQASAGGAHPELLRFFRQPAANVLDEAAGLGHTSTRKLQQTFESPDLPFTFDGFGFGYGGQFPGGGAFNNFAVNIYNIFFRDIFNEGLNEYLARLLPNTLPDAANFVPPTISQYFTRDVEELFGFNFFDRYIGQYYTFATAELGDLVDAGCTGPVYSLKVDGGSCEIMDDGSVHCTPPSINLTAEPTVCNLPYRSAATLEGAGWQYVAKFGRERSGNIGPPAGQYNFGAALNVTAPYIGFSVQLQRLANDFGVQQWYQFVGNLVLNELVRIQRALLDTTVDDNLATAFGTTGRRLTDTSSAASNGVLTNLLQKIATRMDLSTQDLIKGLSALGLYNGPDIQDDGPRKSAGTTNVTTGKEADTKLNKPASINPANLKTATQAKGAKPVAAQSNKQAAQPKPVAQRTQTVQATDESEGDRDLLSHLDMGTQLMNRQAQSSMAAATKRGP